MAGRWRPPPFVLDELTRVGVEVALLTGNLPTTSRAHDPQPAPTDPASRARLLLAGGDLPAAGAEAEAALAIAAGHDSSLTDLVAHVEALLVRALIADRGGQAFAASADLRRTLEIAGPHHLVRPFLVTGSVRTPALLRRLADGQVSRDPFLVDLLDRFPDSERVSPEPAVLTAHLTGRELAMLAELPTMKGNAEIAADHFVCVNTVKARLKGLYRKLEVDSRRAAVHRARDLGLRP